MNTPNLTYEEQTGYRQPENSTAVGSEEHFRNLIHSLSDVIVLFNAQGKLLFISSSVERVLGYQPQALMGKSLLDYAHPEDVGALQAILHQAITTPGAPFAVEFRCRKADGAWTTLEAQGNNLLHLTTVSGLVANLRDVTGRKETEEQLRRSLQRTEVLLQEIYHRVKNNLQVIWSLLDIQVEASRDKALIRILRESQSRIYSIALVHERLYQSEDLHEIDFAEYVQSLTQYILEAYGASHYVKLVVAVPSVRVDLDTGMRCGLILNELLSNALKYAFPQQQAGSLQVLANTQDSKLASLVVEDNGIGLPDNFRPGGSLSLGLKLVELLTRQLQGQFLFENLTSGGARFTLFLGPGADAGPVSP